MQSFSKLRGLMLPQGSFYEQTKNMKPAALKEEEATPQASEEKASGGGLLDMAMGQMTAKPEEAPIDENSAIMNQMQDPNQLVDQSQGTMSPDKLAKLRMLMGGA